MSALVQQTQEWLNFRKNHLGASDAPPIMDVSPWKTSYQLWLEKMDLIPSTFQSSAMKRGIQLESEASLNFSLMTGHAVSPKVIIHPAIPFMMASMDGISEDGKVAVEIKCPGFKDHSLAATGVVPEKYYPQLQHQLEVCQLDKLYYFSFSADSQHLIEMGRNDKYIKTMLEKEEEFWECMQTFVAPACKNPAIIRNDDIWRTMVDQWNENELHLNPRLARKEEMRKGFQEMAGDYTTVGHGLRVMKVIRKGLIDYSKVSELKGIDLEPYRKESIETWKITAE